jgi:hypothetical protein
MASAWGHNFMNNHLDYTFNEFAQVFYKEYHKVQTDEHIYINLWIVKHILNKRIEKYHERIFILTNSLQHQVNDHLP